MQTRKTIETRLQTLIQAYGFSHSHLEELSNEARIKLRILEENIKLLQWCLEDPEPTEVTWQRIKEDFVSVQRSKLKLLVSTWNLLKPK